MSSSQPIICVQKQTRRVFCGELTEFVPKLSAFSPPKQVHFSGDFLGGFDC